MGELPAAWVEATLRAHLEGDASHYASAEAAHALGKTRAASAFDALVNVPIENCNGALVGMIRPAPTLAF